MRCDILEKMLFMRRETHSSQRLLGTFSYARQQNGSEAWLGRIDFADLLFAKERFFTADNATIAVSGNFDPSFGLSSVEEILWKLA